MSTPEADEHGILSCSSQSQYPPERRYSFDMHDHLLQTPSEVLPCLKFNTSRLTPYKSEMSSLTNTDMGTQSEDAFKQISCPSCQCFNRKKCSSVTCLSTHNTSVSSCNYHTSISQTATSKTISSHSRGKSWLARNLLFIVKFFIISHIVHTFHIPFPAVAAKVRYIHWNTTNPMFHPTGENKLFVQLNDELQFVCPQGSEMYKLYWTVDKNQHDQCSGGIVLFSCNGKTLDQRYMINVYTFSPDPSVPSFSTKKPVYIFSPSSGTFHGLEQTEGGVCRNRNMKLSIIIGDEPTTTTQTSPLTPAPPPQSPTTTGKEIITTTTEEKPARTPVVRETTTKKLLSPTLGEQDSEAHTGRRMITGASSLHPGIKVLFLCLTLNILLRNVIHVELLT